MHFYIDESGHTGSNLFDLDQPMLYYGVLSSQINVDVVADDFLSRLRNRVGVPRLHAADLGNSGLAPLALDLLKLQKRLDLRFDLYRVAKYDHAIISFFDQVFDVGLNPAVTWSGYWTPLRYILLLRMAALFDEDLARLAWEARLERSDMRCHHIVAGVCTELLMRVESLSDPRSRQLIGDTLLWAAKNPSALGYNIKGKTEQLTVMPNMIGFQSVMIGIAKRLLKSKRNASRIVVDQQSQFNKSQKSLAQYYAAASSVQFANGPGLPEISFKGVPDIPIEISSGNFSSGLELVDIYLWVFKRLLEEKDIAPELVLLAKSQFYRARTDEVSLSALALRWKMWFEQLPEPTDEQIVSAAEICAADEARRQRKLNEVLKH